MTDAHLSSLLLDTVGQNPGVSFVPVNKDGPNRGEK